jgi:hypothetical protein
MTDPAAKASILSEQGFANGANSIHIFIPNSHLIFS